MGVGRACRRFAVPVIVLALANCPGECESDNPLDPGGLNGHFYSKLVKLQNNSSEAVHLFSKDQDQGFPCCQVAPGGSRDALAKFFVRFDDSDKDDPQESVFEAGRNGNILFVRTCTTTKARIEAPAPLQVVFTESGLSCVGW